MSHPYEQHTTPERAQSPEELLGMLETSFMVGDLQGAVWFGQQLLGMDEVAAGRSYTSQSAYNETRDDPATPNLNVYSLGNDRSDFFGNGKRDPIAFWQSAPDRTSPGSFGAMQVVLREGLGRYGWHYDNSPEYRSRGRFVGASVLGSDLQPRVVTFDGPNEREHLEVTGFMHSHGYSKANRSEQPKLLQWCDSLQDSQQGANFRKRIEALLYADPHELADWASVNVSEPNLVVEGVARTQGRHRATVEAPAADYVARHATEHV